MADLPAFRLTCGLPPFTNTGVDYFGPIEVIIFRRTIKRWGVLFTCLATRCVHLEMAYSLDTSSFISALDRFQNRRGVPASFHSDNGTNFVGAQRQLAECLDNLNQSAIITHLNRKRTKWYFNPPAAPHFGGVWERMVRAAKEALSAVLGRQRLTDELLVTTLTHVEMC
jgi:transposase InsO family protein